MGADADRCPAEIELADVDGVEGRVPGVGARGEHLLLGDRIGAQGELGDVHLGLDDVLHALVVRVVRSDREEDVLAGVRVLSEDAEQRGLVAVADVVLATVRLVGAIGHLCEHHLARVEVGAMGLLRQAEAEDATVEQVLCGALLDLRSIGHPQRSEAEDADLPGVPVGEPVEAEDLVENTVPAGVPARIGIVDRVLGGRQHGREDTVLFDEVEEVAVPASLVVVLLETDLALRLEELDGLLHDLP